MLSSSGLKKFSKVLLVVNKKSTKGISESVFVSNWLKENDVDHKLFISNSIDETKELIKAYSSSENLIISVSGDGGYNTVINQVAPLKDKPHVVAWPGGNANDWCSLFGNKKKLKKAIISGNTRCVDLLEVVVTEKNGNTVTKRCFAHSYIGFGLTADAAIMLERTDRIKGMIIPEASVVFRVAANKKCLPTSEYEKVRLKSLTIHNHSRMAKLLKVRNSICDDGLFEVVALHWDISFPKKITYGLLGYLEGERYTRYKVFVPNETNIQIDGEVVEIPADSHVEISIAVKALKTLDWDI